MTLLASFITKDYSILAADTLIHNPGGTKSFGHKIRLIDDLAFAIHEDLTIPVDGENHIEILDEIEKIVLEVKALDKIPQEILKHLKELWDKIDLDKIPDEQKPNVKPNISTGVVFQSYRENKLLFNYIDCIRNDIYDY